MGGIKGIARVTSKIVPFMAVIYVVTGLIIILMHFSKIPAAFGAIFAGAFTPEGVSGGVIGVLFQGLSFLNLLNNQNPTGGGFSNLSGVKGP